MLDRARVMRAVQQPVLETVLNRRLGVVEHAVAQPGNRIDQHRRREFTAGKHVVTDRDFLVDLGLDQALVHTLVAAAQQHEPIPRAGIESAFMLAGANAQFVAMFPERDLVIVRLGELRAMDEAAVGAEIAALALAFPAPGAAP